jgi:hypothetical protein
MWGLLCIGGVQEKYQFFTSCQNLNIILTFMFYHYYEVANG